MNDEIILNNVKAYNELVDSMQKIQRDLKAYTQENELKFKADGTLFAKNYDAVRAIFYKHAKKNQQFFFRTKPDGVECKTHYVQTIDSNGYSTVSYINLWFYLDKEIIYKKTSLKQILTLTDKIKKLRDKKLEAEKKLRDAGGNIVHAFGHLRDIKRLGY